MKALPLAARRLALLLVVLAAVIGPTLTTLWVSTPSGTDVQARVEDLTRHYGVVLLGPGDIPSILAKAVVASRRCAAWSQRTSPSASRLSPSELRKSTYTVSIA